MAYAYVIYNVEIGNAFVFFDGSFGYKTEINKTFIKDIGKKTIAGTDEYWERYDMEIYKNNPSEYPYYRQN